MTLVPEAPSRLRIAPISRLTGGGGWQIEAMRALREPLLLWFTLGQGRITVAGSTRGFHAHNAIFIPAGTMYGFTVTHRAQGMAVYFGRACRLDLPDRPLHFRLRDHAPQNELGAIIDNMQRELDSGRTGASTAAEHHLGLLAVWLQRQMAENGGGEEATARRASERLAARYVAVLERDFRSGLGVADYAAALGVTATHLTRACKDSCGRTALDLLLDRRLFEARRLLLDTDIPIKSVARMLGYSTPGYFTRSFQQHTGETPSSFRKGSNGRPRA